MSEKYKFFNHSECEYFPCHKTDNPETFNCLFCYCPLYMLGEACGGNFKYSAKGYKDCTDCDFPHRPENYAVITGRYKEIAEKIKKDI